MFQTPKHLISSPTKPYFRHVPLKMILKLKLKLKTVVKKEEVRMEMKQMSSFSEWQM
jgi:hypothetical protein